MSPDNASGRRLGLPRTPQGWSACVAGVLLAAGLAPLGWMIQAGRALSWDEVGYFRATDRVAQGRAPYRDFFEHHPPLQWVLVAPVARLTEGPGGGTPSWRCAGRR